MSHARLCPWSQPSTRWLFRRYDTYLQCSSRTLHITQARTKQQSSRLRNKGSSPVRTFSSTSSRLAEFVNHYEVLRLPPTATKAELKKQFYTLSKETHPDRHPDDPTAAERFSQLSESYSILGNEEKRRRYDRDFQRAQGGGGGGGTRGEPRSGSYAGSRPASGLSKRRGTFRGPPPSFYQQGNYGSQSARSQAEANQHNQSQGGTFNAQAFNESPGYEFNPHPTFKTQTAEDQRRAARRTEEFQNVQAELDAMKDSDFWGRFVIVSTIVLLGVTIGTMVVNMSNTPRGGLTRSDGSRRGQKDNDWAKG